jgi:hypothetical protein
MLKETLLQLQALVEPLIANEMKKMGIGSIIHDGRTEARRHYLGLFATYNKTFC